jgi:tripartite-type tricarboxylate transporter receptor subunit TctC
MPDVSSRLTELGFAPGDMTADQYQAFVRAELLKWSDLVKRAGIPVQ